jgi:hypothetical protein
MYKAIKNLRDKQEITFKYNGKHYKLYTFGCNDDGSFDLWSVCLMVSDFSLKGDSMNISTVTEKYLSLYDFSIFGVRSSYKIPMSEITDVVVIGKLDFTTSDYYEPESDIKTFNDHMDDIIQSGMFGAGTAK